MCELLAMSANVPTDICFSFSGLMQRGGKTGPHKDGWGITFYEGKGCRSFKDPLPSAESKIAQFVTQYPIKSKAVICHIRQANSGAVCLENTHPFIRPLWGKNWTYAHNGQLANYKETLVVNKNIPIGTTDSELAFCWILDRIEEKFGNNEPNANELFAYVAQQCLLINDMGVFNILLSDGQHLFIFCSNNLHWITRRAPFGNASLIDAEMTVDFNNETTSTDIVTVIATRPLTDNEQWTKMEPKTWQLFCEGVAIN